MPNISQKHIKIGEKQLKNTPSYLYIYLYFYGRALASSGRGLDVTKRSRDVATPKKRMLGLTPMVVFKVDASRKRISRCLWRPPKYSYI